MTFEQLNRLPEQHRNYIYVDWNYLTWHCKGNADPALGWIQWDDFVKKLSPEEALEICEIYSKQYLTRNKYKS